MINKGAALAIRRDVITIDPDYGKGRLIEWNGTRPAIEGLVATLQNQRARITLDNEGALWTLTAVFQNILDGSDEVPTDRWSIVTEPIEVDGFKHPVVNAEMNASIYPQGWKFFIEKSAEDKPDSGESGFNGNLDTEQAADSVAFQMYQELLRGATHFEDEYLTLRMVRTISPLYTTKMSLTANRLIYASAQLPVPSSVLFTLPETPAGNLWTTYNSPPANPWPYNTQWGWRLRTQSSDFAGNKVEQTFEWVFAAWSLLYYATSSSNFDL